MSNAQEIEWPPLSRISFVSGRVASEEDINLGGAAFMLQRDGINIGEPIDIEIPQYAFHVNEETDVRTPVIVIQAESAEGNQVIGYYIFDSKVYGVGLIHEFEFLGLEIQ